MNRKNRCEWCLGDDLYTAYHDNEWGVPNHDDRRHFEMLILEQAQAGLSWITILRKRENYRRAYDNFEVSRVAKYSGEKIDRLMEDSGIIRNRRKIIASINAANVFLAIAREFGSFDNYIWSFTNGRQVVGHHESIAGLPAFTPLSQALSQDMKKRGITFFGPTIAYSFLQAIGVVNDHVKHCFMYKGGPEIKI
jgi:DNA-3-methyladenine glycosylase I